MDVIAETVRKRDDGAGASGLSDAAVLRPMRRRYAASASSRPARAWVTLSMREGKGAHAPTITVPTSVAGEVRSALAHEHEPLPVGRHVVHRVEAGLVRGAEQDRL